MFKKIKEWVKTHKQFTFNIVAVVIIFLFLFSGSTRRIGYRTLDSSVSPQAEYYGGYSPAVGSIDSMVSLKSTGSRVYYDSVSNEVSQEDRKVITNSNFSLHVKDVDDTAENIRQKVIQMGGFMVNTSISRGDSSNNAILEVRVPADQLVDFSKYLRGISVKVVSENVAGRDITDQYTDYEEKLASLELVKERFEEIMDEAETVDEIMNVQNRILTVQSQIDAIKGQLTYMNRSVETTKVTIMLSTDELSLPYTPKDSWRVDVISKRAIRSLISVLRLLGTLGIWVLVFFPLFLLVVAVKITIKYLLRNKKKSKEKVKDIK